MRTYDVSFFRRGPMEVAEELIGSRAVRYGDREINMGFLTELNVLVGPPGSNEENYRTPAGMLVRFSTRTGFMLGVSAHKPGETGIITFIGMKSNDEFLDSAQTYSALGGDIVHTKFVGQESGLYIAESGFDFESEGLVISRELPSNLPPNRIGYLKLTPK